MSWINTKDIQYNTSLIESATSPLSLSFRTADATVWFP